MTNNNLWEKIQDFEFDHPNEEYGFSTRLALENSWTLHFTQQAILEYKKFMYLAAVNQQMVSPSETVDKVWHQHLIFTKSYTDLCAILGKRIEHIPSTHTHVEKEKFSNASQRTKTFYETDFGKQPPEIWEFHEPFDSLPALKSKGPNTSDISAVIILGFVLLIYPVFLLIRPILQKIPNPGFLTGYLIGFGILFLVLERFVKRNFHHLFSEWNHNATISNLDPLELVYMKYNQLDSVIHGVVFNLIRKQKIKLISDKLFLVNEEFTNNKFENCVIETLRQENGIYYRGLLQKLRNKNLFFQFRRSMTKINDYISSSSKLKRLTVISLITCSPFYMIGTCRIISGMLNQKPMGFLVMAQIIILIGIVLYIIRLQTYLTQITIPSHYRKNVTLKQEKQDWRWNYFIDGKHTFTFAFAALVSNAEVKNRDGSGYGSSCGSSCGGGCGGCGGD